MSKTVLIEIDVEHLKVLSGFAKILAKKGKAYSEAYAAWETRKAVEWTPEIAAARRAEVSKAYERPRLPCGCNNAKAVALEQAYTRDMHFFWVFHHEDERGLGDVARKMLSEPFLDALSDLAKPMVVTHD